MSIDKSLKKGGGLTRARNVLKRAERLALLQEDERWTPEKGVFNLPKTKYRRLAPGQSGPKRPGTPNELSVDDPRPPGTTDRTPDHSGRGFCRESWVATD